MPEKVSATAWLRALAGGLAAVALLIGAALPARAQPAGPDMAAVLGNYRAMAEAVFQDALAGAKALQKAVDALLARPDPQTLAEARRAWIAARVPYLQSEAFRFTNPAIDEWEGKVNAWPLDEGLIDYVAAKPESDNPLAAANVIASTSIKINGTALDVSAISKELLEGKLHEAGGVKANVATGYHAIEFLLWGQDLNGTGAGAGNRPATDYDKAACTHGNCERRAAYLKVATDLLVDDLADMAGQWAEGGAPSKRLLAMAPDDALVAIFTGLASLSYGELAGERMKLALLLHDPEEEQDCFSDNTHNSLYYDVVGIENVYLGRYRRSDGSMVQGPSVSDVVKARAPVADEDLRKAFAGTVGRMRAIVDKASQGMAFDMMIAEGNGEGNALVQAGIDALLAQTTQIRRAVVALKLKNLKVQEPERLGGATGQGKGKGR